jgi:hypothetical protein
VPYDAHCLFSVHGENVGVQTYLAFSDRVLQGWSGETVFIGQQDDLTEPMYHFYFPSPPVNISLYEP